MARNNGNDTRRRAQQSKRRRPDQRLIATLVARSIDGATFPNGDAGARAFDPAAVRKNDLRQERRAA